MLQGRSTTPGSAPRARKEMQEDCCLYWERAVSCLRCVLTLTPGRHRPQKLADLRQSCEPYVAFSLDFNQDFARIYLHPKPAKLLIAGGIYHIQ